jgi:hypothetical protein
LRAEPSLASRHNVEPLPDDAVRALLDRIRGAPAGLAAATSEQPGGAGATAAQKDASHASLLHRLGGTFRRLLIGA